MRQITWDSQDQHALLWLTNPYEHQQTATYKGVRKTLGQKQKLSAETALKR
jgi:hypothetical protein